MNDRFKFRAWDKKHGIMVYCEEEASREQIHEYEALYDWDEDYGCWEYKCLSGLDSLIRDDNFVLEQCTGLRDRNGKLIYEGDIVKDDIGMIAPVCFDEVNALFYIDSYIGVYSYPFAHFYHYDSEEELEVIGNIHENKDLIKVGGK